MFEIRCDTVLSDNGIYFKSFAYYVSPCIAVTIFRAAGKTRYSPNECDFFVYAINSRKPRMMQLKLFVKLWKTYEKNFWNL